MIKTRSERRFGWRALLRAAAACTLAAGAAPGVWASEPVWQQMGYDATRSYHQPNETVLGPDNVASLVVRWKREDLDAFGFVSSPVYKKRKLGVCTGNNLFEWWNARNGNSLGQDLELPVDRQCHAPAIGAGNVYLAYSNPTTIDPPPGRQEFGAFDRHTGQALWGLAVRDKYNLYAIPTLTPKRLYTGEKGKLYALDPETGAQLWSGQSGRGRFDSPTVGAGVVVGLASDADSFFPQPRYAYTFDENTGRLLWKMPAGVYSYAASIAGGKAILTDLSAVMALEPRTGAVLWRTSADPWLGLAVADGTVYAMGQSKVTALDLETGAVKWTVTAGVPGMGASASNMVVANGVLYYLVSERYYFGWRIQLRTLNAATGEPITTLNPVTMVGGYGRLIVADGMVYAVVGAQTVSSKVFAFGLRP